MLLIEEYKIKDLINLATCRIEVHSSKHCGTLSNNSRTGFPRILKKSYFALRIFAASGQGLKFLLKLNLCFH